MTPPIIIIGMHRSGTTLISKLLESFGWFGGKNKDPNNEPYYFIRLNDWLMYQAGASWDNPQTIPEWIQHERVNQLFVPFLNQLMKHPTTINYLGWRKWLQGRDLTQQERVWGWKDPRTTLTLPLWLNVFPEAKVIHVYRHGVDVAQSLRHRTQKENEEKILKYSKYYYLSYLFNKGIIFNDSRKLNPPALLSLAHVFNLWEFYIKQGFASADHLHPDRLMHIKYEDFLEQPIPHLRSMLGFCGLPIDEARLQSEVSQIKIERKYAYQQSDELRQFAESVKERLAVFGYSV